MQPTLYIVGTPIGNLEDITARAVRVLSGVDTVLCEDTRMTRKLLTHLGIEKALVSYHAHSGMMKHDKVIALLSEGKSLALVSDAGTPSISDPGARLVDAVRTHFGDAVSVVAVPGPSAVAAALSVTGFPADSFHFFGFPPHKKGRATFFDSVAGSDCTTVLYESPHRLLKALASLADRTPLRRAAVCRELTKIHEEVVRGTVADVLAHFTGRPDTVRGEIVIVLAPL